VAGIRKKSVFSLKLFFQKSGQTHRVDTDHPIDISIPLHFNGEQPNAYDAPPAAARAFEAGRFIGDTRRGGSCNVEEYKLIPHCNGTHTECVGHIALERISIHSVLKNSWIPAALISISPVPGLTCDEVCRPEKKAEDLLLTKQALAQALQNASRDFLEGLIIRTLPNDASKKSCKYGEPPPPYFTVDAMLYINELNVQHLLVDVPSVDRTADEGKMTAHHLYWNVPEESHKVNAQRRSLKTITEMIFVPDEVSDGHFLLNLQIPSFVADAVPSRPMIHKFNESQEYK
jgi:kynurenine formamidase